MIMTEEIISIENLKAYYVLKAVGGTMHAEIKAVDGVSMKVHSGEILGIAGESGCGKSTLIKTIYGLVEPPLTVVDGSITYNLEGRKISLLELDKSELGKLWFKDISYIPQGSMSALNPVRKIKDQFFDVIKSHYENFNVDEMEQLMIEHFDRLGLPKEVLSSYPHQLSGGMRQRVVIALATLLKPRVILADEPTTALDVVVQRGILQLLARVQQELKSTLVVVTHDMGVHAQIAHRLAVMYAGKIVEIGTVEEVFEDPLHPYTKHLIRALPMIGDKARRAGIPGKPPSLRNPPSGCRFHPRCPYATDVCKSAEPLLAQIGRSPSRYVACHLYSG
jgi:peptide/nickel transport system ATP-binding protein